MSDITISVEDTINLIRFLHRGQTYTSRPMWMHPVEVMMGVEGIDNAPEWVKHAALLHDSYEDTEITMEILDDLGYSYDVCIAVELLTHCVFESYDEYIRRMVFHSKKMNTEWIMLIKISDMKANIRNTPSRIKKYAPYLKLLEDEVAMMRAANE